MTTITREIPSLSSIVLRLISNKPLVYVTSPIMNPIVQEKIHRLSYDLTQQLIDSITEAGRLTDEVFPIEYFDASRVAISFRNSKLSGKYFRSFFDRCFERMTSVDLSGSFQVDDMTVSYILQKCQNISVLRLQNCRKLTENVLASIVDCSRNIKELDFGGDVNIGIQGVDDFISSYQFMSSIEYLNLSGLIVGDSTVSWIIRKCQSLKSLGIAYADISDQSLLRLLRAVGPKLIYLNLSWLSTTNMTLFPQIDSTLLFNTLVDSCRVLEEIDLSGLKTISSLDAYNFLIGIGNKVSYHFFAFWNIDVKLNSCQALEETGMNHPLKTVHLRFTASSKAQLENHLVSTFPSIRFSLN